MVLAEFRPMPFELCSVNLLTNLAIPNFFWRKPPHNIVLYFILKVPKRILFTKKQIMFCIKMTETTQPNWLLLQLHIFSQCHENSSKSRYIAQAYHEMRLTIFDKNFERHLFVLNSTQNDVRWGLWLKHGQLGILKIM